MIINPTKRFLSRIGVLCALFLSVFSVESIAQELSVAMRWSEVQLSCIRKDAARPTIQARNLYHSAIVMYDAWAVYDDNSTTVLLGKTLGNYTCDFDGIAVPEDVQAAQEEAISYAMYRFLTNRYQPFAPTPTGAPANNWVTFMQGYVDGLMTQLGYDPLITSTDYSDGDPAKLGNYIAMKMQEYGLQDGANQANNYANLYYQTVNGNLFAELEGNPLQYDGNRWQPLALTTTLDQNGLPIPSGQPALSAEWGRVTPFALTPDMKTVLQRDGNDWDVYLDPGPPPFLDTTTMVETQWDEDFFRWGYINVIIWHSFHDVADGVMKDISPNSIGNIDVSTFPETFQEYKDFYNTLQGGDPGIGYDINPVTGQPYDLNMVPRADYSRVLSEYWADGPNSETPPGHWFKNINNIAQHPLFEKRWEGQGEILGDLEWDVRAYLALGGGIHDAAVACWGTKGYYDYTRPIMAIRYMIDHGQCSDMNLPNYDPAGIPLFPGYIEVIETGDPLAGANDEHVGKIKLYTFRGPVAATGQDGVGWIRGENWWTFQRRTFVTPPFPGYYSGHSTYSRTAAELLTRISGSEYYPGGMGEFFAAQNLYLAASPGPSVDVTMQWARYADAADQCSLSRIYGGLHPPQDDIPGREVGLVVGPLAFDKAETFMADYPHVASLTSSEDLITDAAVGTDLIITAEFSIAMDVNTTPTLVFTPDVSASLTLTSGQWIDATHYAFTYMVNDADENIKDVIVKVDYAVNEAGNNVFPTIANLFDIDTDNPTVLASNYSDVVINDQVASSGSISITFEFDQAVDPSSAMNVLFPVENPGASLLFNTGTWLSETTYEAVFTTSDNNVTFADIDVELTGAIDSNGNAQDAAVAIDALDLDTQNPSVADVLVSNNFVNVSNIGGEFLITAQFSEAMDFETNPTLAFAGGSTANTLSSASGSWLSPTSYEWSYNVLPSDEEVSGIIVLLSAARDAVGNIQVFSNNSNLFGIDTKAPNVALISTNDDLLSDDNVSANQFAVTVQFDDEMNTDETPVIEFTSGDASSLMLNATLSNWSDDFTYEAVYDLSDDNMVSNGIGAVVATANDLGGNALVAEGALDGTFSIDTENPSVVVVTPNFASITDDQIGTPFVLTAIFDEPMSSSVAPTFTFPIEDTEGAISFTSGEWVNSTTYEASYTINDVAVYVQNIDVTVEGAEDIAGNTQLGSPNANKFSITLTVGVDELNVLSASTIYPNPVKAGTDMIVTMTTIPQDLLVSLVDIHGKLVENLSINSQTGNTVRVSTAGLAAGNYFVKLHSISGMASFQVTVLN